MSRIEGKVAQILNDRELVINRGSTQGVEVGMTFNILNEAGIDIRDPETKDLLGTVEWPKVRVKVVQVQEKMCVARTFRTISIPSKGSRGVFDIGLRMAGDYQPAREEPETLRADGRYAQDLSPEQSRICVGDPAVQENAPSEE